MSFSEKVKNDIIRTIPKEQNEINSTIRAMLHFSSEIILGKPIKLAFTSNLMSIIRYFITLVKINYDVEFNIESRIINRLDNHRVFTCIILDADKIIKDFNLLSGETIDLKTEEEKIAFLKGAFLSRGSVNDPNSKSSHLEISHTSNDEILYVQKLINSFELNSRIAKRRNNLIVYLKSKSSIGDFLYLLGCITSMSYYEDAVITKQIEAQAKRSINLDIANQDKTNIAAMEQLKIIEYLEYNYPLEKLDSKLLMVMKVRKDNKEASLSELLDIIHEEFDPFLSKSGLNHRFRKLKEIAHEFSGGKI
ncbi:MAG: DNA-binding protein WhiA [Acholeplasmatales bacterium]|nr:DNA-binding protein WhiA [Acholeplasmatales bacterium]